MSTDDSVKDSYKQMQEGDSLPVSVMEILFRVAKKGRFPIWRIGRSFGGYSYR
jgi:hypothetical protein